MTDDSMTSTNISEGDLVAYADGTLDPSRRALLTDTIARDPELAATVAAFREQTAFLQKTFDHVLGEPVPLRLLATVHSSPVRQALRTAAVACFVLTIGTGIGWMGRDAVLVDPMIDRLGQRAALAYTTFGTSETPLLDVSPAAVSTGGWPTKTLGRQMRAPLLTPLGFELVGGRLMMGDTMPAALLIYHDQDGRRLAIFIRSDIEPHGATPMRQLAVEPHPAVYWTRDAIGVAVSGNLTLQELTAAAEIVRAQSLI